MIFYIGYYDCEKIKKEKRKVSPAAVNKMEYIIYSLKNILDEEIEVISPAETELYCFVKGKKLEISKKLFVKTFSSFSSRNKIVRILGHFLTKITFCTYLFKNIKKGDHIIVYHSLVYMKIIEWIKLLKKCKLTIEIEELYSDVTENENLRKKEIKFFQIADDYIFITSLLREIINTEKPAVISHGTYKAIPNHNFNFKDNKIHVVYAGTFNKIKGGVFKAISVAEYLDESYVMEILGNGSQKEIQEVKNAIENASKPGSCEIRYVGYKFGDDFNAYIQACDIGLSTQQAEGKFNATSFPSKILMYMSNGLRVVSVKIPAVETSDVGEYVYYYEKQTPEEIAKTIKSINLSEIYDGRNVLEKMDVKFNYNFSFMLRNKYQKN